ncbi:MAG: hypothetical protein Q4B17_00200 [Lautropia sp.]|nr:hypothetical protein [Lautropia sp.]
MFSRKRPFSRWRRLALHLLGLGCGLASLLPAAADAAVQEIRQSLTADGTPRFDARPGPGMDTGPSNAIVRTHDSIEYQITVITSGHTGDLNIRLQLPAAAGAAVARWQPPPPQCQPGSGLADDHQVLSCRLPAMPTAGTRSFYVRANVLGNAAHGTRIPAPDMQVFEQEQPVSPRLVAAQPVTVSAAPFYDVHLEMSYAGNPRAFGYQQGSGPQGRDGFFHRPLIGLIARHPNGHGRKGVEALDPTQPVEIELDVSGYPASVRPDTWHDRPTSPAIPGSQATADFQDGCGSPALGQPASLSGGRINDYDRVTDSGPQDSTAPNSVANGGECRIRQADRHRITLSLHGIDTRLTHVPGHKTRSGKRIAAAEAWVANKALVLWTDAADYPEKVNIPHQLQLSRVSGRSLSGQPLRGDRPANNQLQHAIRAETGGSANIVMAPDATLEMPWASVADPTLPSYQTVNQLAPGQSVRPVLQVRNQGTQAFHDTYLCAILDRSAFDLGGKFHARQHEHTANHRIRYGALPSGTPYFDSTETATRAHGAPKTPATQAAYTQASCNSPDIRWFDTHAEAEAAGGLVFIRADLPLLPAGARTSLAINNLILRRTWASTVTVMGPTPGIREAGAPIAPGTIIRTRAELFTPSTTLTSADTDHLEVVETRTVSRLSQQIRAQGKPVTRVPAGAVLRYTLDGRYTTEFPPRPDTVIITQILPAGIRYLTGSSRVGDQPREPEIRQDQPSPGQTTLTWPFHDQTPTVTRDIKTAPRLPRIEFDAQVSRLLADGLQLVSHASIRGGANDFEADCVHQPDQGFGDCAKAAATTLNVQSPPGFLLEKSALTPTVAPGEPFAYLLSFGAIGRELRQPDMPDIIDILPFAGDGVQRPGQQLATRTPASRFGPGAYALSRVVPPAHDPDALVYYTRRPPTEIHNDPQHPDNQLDGARASRTRWCLGHELGSPGCPARIAEATAIRIRPGLPMIAANSVYEIRLDLKTHPLHSQLGDRFANRAGSRPGATLPYIESPANIHVQVQAPVGSLAGRVFADLNRNGALDAGDWPLSGECIDLDGRTPHGRPLQYSTRTDTAGAYHFGPDQSGIHPGSGCQGSPLASFAGLLAGTYQLHRRPDLGKPYPRLAEQAGNLGGTMLEHRITDIRLAPGQQGQDYDFMLFPPQPVLTLTGIVHHAHGGQARPEDLVLEARQLDTTPPSQPIRLTGSSGSPGLTRQSVPPGRYQLGISLPTGYRADAWQCRAHGKPFPLQASGAAGSAILSLDHGDQVICHLIIRDQPSQLTLLATITNRHGRQARPSDVRLHADGPSQLSGFSGSPAVTDVETRAGIYQLRSDTLPHYVAGAWQCDAGHLDANTLTLGPGEHATCTINHTDQPLSLTLVMEVLNQYGGTASVRDQPLSAEGPDAIQGISGTEPVTVAPVRPGVYELSMPELPGYVSGKWVCSAGRLDGNRLHLGHQLNVTCRIVLKDLPTTMGLTQQVIGEPRPVPGTDSDYQVDYQISIRHQGGGEGVYSLSSQPGFDPDVQILSASLHRDQQTRTLRRTSPGQWMLTGHERLPIGAEHQYRLRFHVRVPYGSNSRNNRCAARGEPRGHGLWHQALLTNHSSDIRPAPQTGAQACADTPIPAGMARLSIEKTASRRNASVGETLHYRIRIRNHGPRPAISPELIDRLPAGFRFEPGSLRVQNARLLDMRQQGSREIRILLDRIEPWDKAPRPSPAAKANGVGVAGTAAHPGSTRGTFSTRATSTDSPLPPRPMASTDMSDAAGAPDILISYRVRVGVGSQEGDGINRAHVECLSADGLSRHPCSNHARSRVRVEDGVFRQQACLAGQIFVDCNGNALKDPDEPGIPNVRLYLQNGNWLLSDTNGRYSLCGLRPRIHVLKVDARTLPARSHLVTSSPQNGGDAESLFIDARKGMLHRADFIEGSCRPEILNEVHRRQTAPSTKDRIPRPHPSGFYMDSGRPGLTLGYP